MPPRANHPDVNLNLRVRGLSQSATLSINERSKLLESEGQTIYKLGLGQSPFPVPEPVVKALQASAHEKAYLPVKGLYELREAVAKYHCGRESLDCSASGVLIGPGSKELMFIVQLVYYGELIIPTPSWVSYAPQAAIIGRNIRWVPTCARDQWRLTPAGLDAVCREDPDRPRLLILNYPNNPGGTTYDVEELQAIATVARKYKVVLLSDEIYGELNHAGEHVSVARFYPEGTIISSGLSKWCGAGGWRLGTFTFPKSMFWLLEAMAVVASETFTATSTPIQYAAIRAFQGGPEIGEYLVGSRRVLRLIGQGMAQRLQETGIHMPTPKGAFYLLPDFSAFSKRLHKRGIDTSAQLCERLLQDTGVATLAGTNFGFSPEFLGARLSYVDFDGRQALEAIANTPPTGEDERKFVENIGKALLTAVDLICEWLQKAD